MRSFIFLGGGEIAENEAISILGQKERFIIKPAIESGRGRDVKMVYGKDGNTESLKEVLDTFQSNYIIQEVVEQHDEMKKLNKTSLNTCRLYTYRTVEDGRYVLLGAAVRFGGDGAFRDNACTGGGFCKIFDDGTIDDKVYSFRHFGYRSLQKMKGLYNHKIPNYNRVVSCCIDLHKTIPYMDLIGWDIAVMPDGNPMLIELNQYPDCEFIQIFNGPMFGDHTDALMDKISHHKLDCISVYKRSFENGHKQYEYNFEIGKAYSI